MTKKEIAILAVDALKKEFPDAICSLTYKDPLQLLVATRLAAQCTDARVNMVTPALFEKYKCAEDFANANVEALWNFYDTYFKRKDISVDGNEVDVNPVFQPKYYFLGLRQSAQQTNATLYQTIGWEDYSHGGMGTFDPLAE